VAATCLMITGGPSEARSVARELTKVIG
jgi:hypothetical protein